MLLRPSIHQDTLDARMPLIDVWIELGYIFSTKAIWRQRLNWQDSIRLLVRTLSSCCSKKNMVSFRRRTCWFSTAAAFSSYIDKTSLIIVVFSHSFSYVPLYQLHSKLVLPHVCTQSHVLKMVKYYFFWSFMVKIILEHKH